MAFIPALTTTFVQRAQQQQCGQSPFTPSFRASRTARIAHATNTPRMVVASAKPATKPASPCFSSGPCKKRPGYDLSTALSDAPLGRSHRSKIGKQKLAEALSLTRSVLQLPEDYRVAIVPGSDTGAFEMAMWTMLGAKAVDVAHWESFGKGWYTDIKKHLKVPEVREFTVDAYGQIPNLAETSPDHDVVFTYNGTTSGVCVPNLDWVSDDRSGLTLCDATSAVFAMDVDWKKIDVCTYSWQKVLGGEAAHGMLILSPRAVQRLESYVPDRPLPKIFRLTKGKENALNEGIFDGSVINTVSMLCVEDYIDALQWCNEVGGLKGLLERSKNNLRVVEEFVEQREWIDFLAESKDIRSNTSVCLTMKLEKDQVKQLEKMLEKEGVAFDINSYRDAPPGLRIWCGATVETSDVQSLMEWIEWAYNSIIAA